jgi:transposase
MIDMALLSVVRRWHFRGGMLIREITRRTGLSRNTVRKYQASGELEPHYRQPKSPSKLDDYEQTHSVIYFCVFWTLIHKDYKE